MCVSPTFHTVLALGLVIGGEKTSRVDKDAVRRGKAREKEKKENHRIMKENIVKEEERGGGEGL